MTSTIQALHHKHRKAKSVADLISKYEEIVDYYDQCIKRFMEQERVNMMAVASIEVKKSIYVSFVQDLKGIKK